MSQEWYYGRDDEQHGPVSSQELKKLANTGQLRSTDLVWKEGLEEWVPATKVKGLFLAPTAAQWYYGRAGNHQGPVSWDELRRLAEAGTITTKDMVWKEGMDEWVIATQAQGLFPAAVNRNVVCPNCETGMAVNSYLGQRITCSTCGHSFRLRQPRTAVQSVLNDATSLEPMRDMTEAEVTELRSILSHYGERIPFHGVEDFGDQITITSAKFVPVYDTVLQTLCERRAVTEELIPFNGQDVPSATITKSSLDEWSFEFPRHEKFSELSRRHRLAESRTVESCQPCGAAGKVTCPGCGGAKNVTCPTCSGQKIVACHSCGGRGAITKHRSVQVEEKCSGCAGTGDVSKSLLGGIATAIGDNVARKMDQIPDHRCRLCYGRGFSVVNKDQPYDVPCPTCQQHGKLQCGTCNATGQVVCSQCQAAGIVTCSTCQGKTQVVRTLCIDQSFTPTHESLRNAPADVPLDDLDDQWGEVEDQNDFFAVGELDGIRFSEDDLLSPFPKKIDLVQQQVKKLWKQSLEHEIDGSRIHSQRFDLWQATTFAIEYEFDGRAYSLFQLGRQRAVKSNGSPFADITRQMIEKAKTEWSDGSTTNAAGTLRRAWDMGKKDEACQAVVDELNPTLSGPLKAAASTGSAFVSAKATIKKGLGAIGLGGLFGKPKEDMGNEGEMAD